MDPIEWRPECGPRECGGPAGVHTNMRVPIPHVGTEAERCLECGPSEPRLALLLRGLLLRLLAPGLKLLLRGRLLEPGFSGTPNRHPNQLSGRQSGQQQGYPPRQSGQQQHCVGCHLLRTIQPRRCGHSR